ncbi:MAG: chemotaxis protein CheW [Cyanobacteria bacterium P01_F01_bin.150]
MKQRNYGTRVEELGDRTSPDLASIFHRHDNAVYQPVGRDLLERPIPDEYATEWTNLLTQVRHQQQAISHDTLSVNIFRLGREWLALPSAVIKQILPPKPVHSIPHRSNRLLRGIVNVQGQLLLCVSLFNLLDIERENFIRTSTQTPPQRSLTDHKKADSYLLVIERNREVWAFEVDKMYGLHRCSAADLLNAPPLGNQPSNRFTQALISWRDETVSYLDAARVFEALQQEAL